MQVSVIVITYEPDTNKLVATLNSVVHQKDITFEIILSDDGSKNIDIDKVEHTVKGFVPEKIPIQFVKNTPNMGTVLNLYSACQHVSGEYIKIISPGDLLYDENVLHDFYVYAKSHPENSFFFGRPAYYSNNGSIETYDKSIPLYPEIFNSTNQMIQNLALIHGHGPVGASYFHKTDAYKKYIALIANHVKFTEDYTTSILYLLDGGKLSLVDRKVVWYEYGIGISTSNADKWKKIYEDDCKELYEIAKIEHTNNKYIEFRFGDRKKRVLHPILILSIVWINWISKRKSTGITNTKEQIDSLTAILNTKISEDNPEL